MKVLITACTAKIFPNQPMLLAHLTSGEGRAVNDNELKLHVCPAVCPYHHPRIALVSHAAQHPTQKRVRRLLRAAFSSKGNLTGVIHSRG